MIRITSNISLDENELEEHFIRSSGPGGQNVNKVSTAVQLRFDVAGSASLPEDVRRRLIQLAGRRVTEQGVLLIEAKRFRRQERNRQDALDRLIQLIRRAAKRPKKRRKTTPTPAARRRRLQTKKLRSQTKRLRRSVGPETE